MLIEALRNPPSVLRLSESAWTDLIATARAESLLGTLAHRCAGLDLPERVAAALVDARRDVETAQRQALWEAEMARRALAPLGVPVILLKGTAYLAAGLPAAEGRSIGDLDILVPRAALPEVEAALLGAGWEWVKDDPYDQHYYREWMHELPPLIQRERDRMIDVHHTILPLTHRRRPDAEGLVSNSVPILPPFGLSLSTPATSSRQESEEGTAFDKLRPNGLGNQAGLRVLAPADMIVHAAAHLIADGDLAGGLRNLWDIDRLCREFECSDQEFYLDLYEQSWSHGLLPEVLRALRLAHNCFGTPIKGYREPLRIDVGEKWSDRWFLRRLHASDGWGRQTRPVTRLGFYVRSHWMRMPPLMLARHLWRKARS
jgi:hypothetical protein